MAVYTSLTDQQIENFLGHYDVGTLVSAEGIIKGVENTNYKIKTTTGCYILTVYEKRVAASDLPFFFALTAYLAGQGIPCPHTLVGHDKNLSYSTNGRPAALISFLQGSDVPDDSIQVKHCAALGGVIAQMHRATENFPLNRQNDLSLPAWKDISAEILASADRIDPDVLLLIRDEITYLDAHWPAQHILPRGCIHADIFPDNVFFDGFNVSGVIDFYFSCTDFYAYDLAIAVNAWCFDSYGGFHSDRWSALNESYQALRPLDGAEKDFLTILCRGAALRILLTRLLALLNPAQGAMVQPKDPKEYIEKLRWHQNEKIRC